MRPLHSVRATQWLRLRSRLDLNPWRFLQSSFPLELPEHRRRGLFPALALAGFASGHHASPGGELAPVEMFTDAVCASLPTSSALRWSLWESTPAIPRSAPRCRESRSVACASAVSSRPWTARANSGSPAIANGGPPDPPVVTRLGPNPTSLSIYSASFVATDRSEASFPPEAVECAPKISFPAARS